MWRESLLWEELISDFWWSLLLELEKVMPTHFSTLTWKIPQMEEPGSLESMGLQRVRHNWATSLSLSCIGERNGNPLQYCCLENPRDGAAWWAAIYGVAQSRTRLKWLSSRDSWMWGFFSLRTLENSWPCFLHTYCFSCFILSLFFFSDQQ